MPEDSWDLALGAYDFCIQKTIDFTSFLYFLEHVRICKGNVLVSVGTSILNVSNMDLKNDLNSTLRKNPAGAVEVL